jgi:hypothetical protein
VRQKKSKNIKRASPPVTATEPRKRKILGSDRPLCATSGRSTNCHAQRKNMQEKRRLPYRWAAELRRIVGEPVQAESVDLEQHLAA